MKKFVITALLCLSAFALTGCNGRTPNTPDTPDVGDKEVKVVGLELEESIEVDCGFTKQLTANVLPENATNKNVTWSSLDPNIATVDNTGLVTGISHGSTKITCTTEDGNIKGECEVTVKGYKLSSKVFKNFGLLELNNYNVDTDGCEQYNVDDTHEDYIEFSFNRKTTKEWSSAMLWYNQLDTITSLDVEVELVKGSVPAVMVELAGENNFKQFKRIPLSVGQKKSLHLNLTDYNLKTGDQGNGSWGFIFLELNNPNDNNDTTRNNDEEVVLRFTKVMMNEGEKEAPSKIEGLRFDKKLKKIVFEKDVAAQNYELEVYKVEGEKEEKLKLETQMTRFGTAGEKIPNMEVAFTPKKTKDENQNFAEVPGNYKTRVRGLNSAGSGEWTSFVEFTIEGETEEKGSYTYKNISNNGEIKPNGWNGNKTYNAELTDQGYKLSFSSVAEENNPSWDSFVLGFNKDIAYESFTIKFEVVKSSVPLKDILIEFQDWAESEPEASDAKIQHYFDISGREGVIEETVAINKDLSKGIGSIGLSFDRTYGAGDVEILVKEVSLFKVGGEVESTYVYNNILNDGAIVPNQRNGNPTYNCELTNEGYKIAFTSAATSEGPSWDSVVLNFDKEQAWTTFTIKFEVVKSSVPLKDILIEFLDRGESEPEASDAKIQHYFDITGREGVIEETVAIDKDLSKGLGSIGLSFDRTNGAGDVEILIKEVSLVK